MKIAGIVADNYKIEKFKKELTEKGFTDFEIINTSGIDKSLNATSLIRVKVADDKLNDIKQICERIELHFKRSN